MSDSEIECRWSLMGVSDPKIEMMAISESKIETN